MNECDFVLMIFLISFVDFFNVCVIMTRSSFTHSVLVTLTHFKVTGEFENMVMICVDLHVSSFSFLVGGWGQRIHLVLSSVLAVCAQS